MRKCNILPSHTVYLIRLWLILLKDNWSEKVIGRRGQGTGRMRYLKTVPNKAKNGFREGTVPRPKVRKNASK